jgi:hypothetical protein
MVGVLHGPLLPSLPIADTEYFVPASRSGFRFQGSGFRVQGSGFRVQGSGYWVQEGFRI